MIDFTQQAIQQTHDALMMEAYRVDFNEDFAYCLHLPHRARRICFREDYPDAWNGLEIAAEAALNHPTN